MHAFDHEKVLKDSGKSFLLAIFGGKRDGMHKDSSFFTCMRKVENQGRCAVDATVRKSPASPAGDLRPSERFFRNRCKESFYGTL